MKIEWQTAYLTDLYDISSGLSKSAKFFGSGSPFVAFKDVMYNYFLPSELSQLVQSTEQEQEKCSVNRGDVFLTRTSETMNELGMSSVAVKDYEHATFNGFTKRLRPKSDTTLVPEFVAYYLRSPKFRSEMHAFSTMSTRASLNNEMISRLKISFPPVVEQRAIGNVLKTLDDKIELNRRMNETLESMARALFKSWFVDFDPVIDNALAAGNPIPEPLQARAETRRALGNRRKPLPKNNQKLFPNSFVFDDEMGWIPKGWEVEALTEMATSDRHAIAGGPFGSKLSRKHYTSSGVPVIRGANMNGKTGWFHDDDFVFVSEEKAETLLSNMAKPDDVVFTQRGTLGQVALIPSDARFSRYVISQSQMKMTCAAWVPSAFIYLYFTQPSVVDYIKGNATASGVPHINLTFLREFVLLVPSREILCEFGDVVEPLVTRITANERTSVSLAKLRDTLLPKLLSGELRIPDAEKLVANSL